MVADSCSANTFGLIDGGLAGLAWTYLGAYAGFLMVIASMAEMASMWVVQFIFHVLTDCFQGHQHLEVNITGR